MSKKNYAEKLKNPKWQRRRLEVLEKHSFKCEWCSSSDKTLHVHHAYYIPNREPWEHPDTSLMCLCADCHEEWHYFYEEAKFSLKILARYLSREDFVDFVFETKKQSSPLLRKNAERDLYGFWESLQKERA